MILEIIAFFGVVLVLPIVFGLAAVNCGQRRSWPVWAVLLLPTLGSGLILSAYFITHSMISMNISFSAALFKYVDCMTYIFAAIVIMVAYCAAANKIWRLKGDVELSQTLS